MSNSLPEKEKLLQQKRERCMFYIKHTDIFPLGTIDWCNGKDSVCDGWCTA